jgi:hypothetical protein
MGAPTDSLNTLSYSTGFVYTTSTAAITTEHRGVKVVGNSTISSWTDSEGNDLLAKFGLGAVVITSEFPPLVIPAGLKSTSIQFSLNGGVCLIKA